MTTSVERIERQTRAIEENRTRARIDAVVRYFKRNPSLFWGLILFFLLLFSSYFGRLFVDIQEARPVSVSPLRPPSWELPFGSDKQGRNLFAVMVVGTPLTLRIGLIAGFIGVVVGAAIGFISAYYGGWLDAVLRGIVDVGLTIPALMILITVAMVIPTTLTVNQMALIVAALAWVYPARTIRSQVLTLRERSYVQVARLSGMPGRSVILKEILPNLLPYLASSLVIAVSAAVLASIGLEVLGLGPMDDPTVGMTIFWVQYNAAVINGWWWWWLPPIVVIALLFISLFLITIGLDEVANPRLRRRA
jgi:peptide/nickel transport system permease protein